MSIKNKIRKVLFGGLTLFMLGGSPAIAEEITPKPAIEEILEQKVSDPEISVTLNYGRESEQEGAEYLTSKTRFSYENLLTNFSELTDMEETQVENVIKDIQDGDIGSYNELLGSSDNLSENQKLVLLSAIGNLLANGSYDSRYQGEIMPQENFFNSLQDYLETGDQNPLGVCRHIAGHIEQLANDLDIPAAAVSGMSGSGIGHVYDILKLEDGTAIIDYGTIFTTNTKNIERTLEAYQKNRGTVRFYHMFFNDGEHKYRLIPDDGEHFLEFVGYDNSSETLKNYLTQDNSSSPDLEVILNMKNYLSSAEFNCLGLSIKAGRLNGAESSPLDKINLIQTGFKRDFSLDSVNINSELTFMFGNILQDSKLENNNLFGANGNLGITTNFEKGLNFSSRVAGNIFSRSDIALLFYDFLIGAGASCKIPVKNMNIEPYLLTQFNLFPKDLGTAEQGLMFSELATGAIFNFNNFSIDANYLKKPWEQGFGGGIQFNNENIGIDLGGYMTRSNYKFCPHKYGFNVGANLDLENISLGINYELDGTNYDGERENQSSIGVSLNF